MLNAEDRKGDAPDFQDARGLNENVDPSVLIAVTGIRITLSMGERTGNILRRRPEVRSADAPTTSRATVIAASAPSSATAFGGRSFHRKARLARLTVVNAKKVRRLMREHDLNPRRRRRFVRTTDSGHDGPIHPFVANDFEAHGPEQLWGEAGTRAFRWKDRPPNDLTYVAIAAGFAYVARIMDA